VSHCSEIDPHLQDRVKLGVIMGSALAGIGGYLLLRLGPKLDPTN